MAITQRITIDMIMVVSWKQRRYILRLYDIRQSPQKNLGNNTKFGASCFIEKFSYIIRYLYFYVEEKFLSCYHHFTINQVLMVSLEQQATSFG